MFDITKIKVFKLSDLIGRVVKISCFISKEDSLSLTTAIDINTGEIFILTIIPITKD